MPQHDTIAPLTETVFNERLEALRRELRAANLCNEQVQLRFEEGRCSQADADEAAAEVDRLEKRQASIQAAYRHSSRQIEATERSDDEAALKAAIAEADALISTAERHFEKLISGLLELEPHWREVTAARAAIVRTLDPFRNHIEAERSQRVAVFASFCEDLRNNRREEAIVDGALRQIGVLPFLPSATDPREAKPVIKSRSSQIRGALRRLFDRED